MASDVTEGIFDDEGPAANEVWLHLTEGSFTSDWDNELDAIYDNWRDLYGLQEGDGDQHRFGICP
jgi:hypothetical protein